MCMLLYFAGITGPIQEISPSKEEEEDSIAQMCQQLTRGLSALTSEDPFAAAPSSSFQNQPGQASTAHANNIPPAAQQCECTVIVMDLLGNCIMGTSMSSKKNKYCDLLTECPPFCIGSNFVSTVIAPLKLLLKHKFHYIYMIHFLA